MLAAFERDKWEIVRILPIVAALFAQEYLPGQIAEAAGISGPWTLAVKAVCAVVLVLLVAIADVVMRTRAGHAVRRHAAQRMFEGLWAQSVTIPERPYSISLISFDPRQGRWVYAGVAFESNLRPGAEWHTVALSLELHEGERVWFFAGSARPWKYDDILGTTKRAGGAGNVISLLRLPDKRDGVIRGRVADVDVDGVRRVFDVVLKRVPESLSGGLNTIHDILDLKNDKVGAILSGAGIQLLPNQTQGADATLSH